MYGVAVCATLFLSVTSYYFVEEPARTGSFASHVRPEYKALVAVAAATAMLAFIALEPVAQPRFYLAAAQPTGTAAATTVNPSQVQPLPYLERALRDSLTLTSWPKLSNQATVNEGPGVGGCEALRSAACEFAPTAHIGPRKVIVAVGDSVMVSWQSMLKSVFLPNGWTLISLAFVDCFAADVPYADTLQAAGGRLTENANCDAQHRYIDTILATLHPSLVVLDDEADAIYKVSDGHGRLLPHPDQIAAYESGLAKTINLAKSAGARAVVLSATPDHPNWDECKVAGSTPLDCVEQVDPGWQEIQPLDVYVVDQTQSIYVDTLNLWCYQDNCPDVVGNLGTIRDGHHITDEYGRLVAPSLEAYFKKRGII
jgi:hypothetical protein